MNRYRITAALPCFGRPARTRRIINNLLAQTINNWEAFIIGDGCPYFDEMINSGEVEYFIKVAKEKGNKIHCFNLEKNYGGCGYHILNYTKAYAQGEYFVVLNNDDTIKPDHFEYYLSEIENTDLDLVCYPTTLEFNLPPQTRFPYLQIGHIGHSEIITRTKTTKQFKHSSEYGHDWGFIHDIIKNGGKHKISSSKKTTYHVKSAQNRHNEMLD